MLSRSSDELVKDLCVRDTTVSDHFWVEFSWCGPKPRTVKKEITFRKIKAIDTAQFQNDITSSVLGQPDSFQDVDEIVSAYNNIMTDTLDNHAPAVKKTITVHPEAPWYNEEIDLAKKARRKAEKTWRKTKLTVHREIYVGTRETVNLLLQRAKEHHYSNLIAESDGQKDLFKIVNELSNKKDQNVLPQYTSAQDLANRFASFFEDKIVKIRSRLASDEIVSTSVDELEVEKTPVPPVWDEFAEVESEEVRKIVMGTKATTCQLDPIPTPLLKTSIGAILPLLTTIINMSFDAAHFPDELKLALILPILKKLGLDPEIFKHFRPVSNLAYLSKLLERLAASRLLNHMWINKLHELYQSSYKRFHSTETALIKIHSDILSALDKKQCVLLIMLDLSAAFDTIDHNVLLGRMNKVLGASGKVLDWFRSYITGREQAVIIDGVKSTLWKLLFGVPQGSVLGPLLFLIYMSPLGGILRSLGVDYHFYADDSQIYVTFDIRDCNSAVKKVEDVVLIIKNWMRDNFLCLNEEKTEVLLFASKSNQDKLSIPVIKVGENDIHPTEQAKNIGFMFDTLMDGKAQVKQICKSAWFQVRNIGRIRNYLDEKATKTLVHAFITSRIDMNNCLLLGLPDNLINKIQMLQNAAARLIMRLPKHSHISSTLEELHWLPVPQRIIYKTILMVFKALNDKAPDYIKDMLILKSNANHALRSNDSNLFIVPKSKSVRYGDRNFKNVAPKLWNQLPAIIRHCDNMTTFKRLLKTHLFKLAYDK